MESLLSLLIVAGFIAIVTLVHSWWQRRAQVGAETPVSDWLPEPPSMAADVEAEPLAPDVDAGACDWIAPERHPPIKAAPEFVIPAPPSVPATVAPVVPTALGARPDMQLIREVDYGAYKLQVFVSTEEVEDSGPHGEYAEFVERMWARSDGVELPAVEMTTHRLHHAKGRRACQAMRVLRGDNGEIYVNVVEGGVRLTFNALNGHNWQRNGADIEAAGFRAILDGLPVEVALAPKPYPASPAEALAHDYVDTADRKWIIAYRDQHGVLTFRVISRIMRRDGKVFARCHLRFGERRAFLAERIEQVFDGATGEVVIRDAFLTPRDTRKRSR